MQPEDFLGHLFTTDKQIAAKTASDFTPVGILPFAIPGPLMFRRFPASCYYTPWQDVESCS